MVLGHRLSVSVISLLLVLGGLVVPVSLSAQGQMNDDIRELRPDNLDSISLEKAISVALANNPDVAAATYYFDAAAARRRVAVGALLPSVGLQGSYSHYLDPQRLMPARVLGEASIFTDDIVSGALSVAVPVFTGGRLRSQLKAASLNRDAAGLRLSREKENLVFDVSSVFCSILAQMQVVRSLEFSQEALEEHLQRVRDLIASQKAAKVDRLRTEVRLADLEEQLVSEKNRLAIQKRLLKNLMGVDDTNDYEVTGDLSVDSTNYRELDTYMQMAYQNRKDYLAAKAELQADQKKIGMARATYWPTVMVSASYGYRHAADVDYLPPGADQTEDLGYVGIGVTLPLFEGGAIRAKVGEAKAQVAAADQLLRGLKLRIRLEIETALLNIKSSQERIKATGKSIEQASESLDIEREKYALGKGAIVDVLDAQAALLDAQTRYYRALADYHTAQAGLHLSVGEER